MRAVNDNGEVMEFDGTQWVPVKGAKAEAPAAPRERISTGAVDAALVGAGDVFNSIGINARDLFGSLTGNAGMQATAAADRAEAAGIRERLRSEAPIASAVGGMLPGLATLPLSGGLPVQAALGALTGAASSESGDLGGDAGLGGALAGIGGLAGNIIGRVNAARGARAAIRAERAAGEAGGAAAGALTDAERELIDGARRAGLRLTPGQVTGSPQARQFEAALSSNPATSKIFADMDQANTRQLNALAARAMGVEGVDNVGPAVRAQAAQKLAGEFETIGAQIGAVETAPMVKALQKVADDDALALVPRTEAANLVAKIQSGVKSRSGEGGEAMDFVTGKSLMAERSKLSRSMRDAFANNRSDQGEAYAKLLDIVDEAARRSAVRSAEGNPEAGMAMAQRYDQAREAWSVLRAMDRGGASIDGNVMPGQAARIAKSSDKGGLWGLADESGVTTQRRGGNRLGDDALGDYYDALRFRSSQLGRDIVGNSGTATRLAGVLGGGGSLGERVVNVSGRALRAVTLNPALKAYSNLSPEAAMQAVAIVEAAKAQQRGATAIGGGIGRALGGAGL